MKLPYNVGVFQLNRLNVKLQLVSGFDSSFTSRPNDNSIPLLQIGADFDSWWKILDALHHEAEEFCMIINGLTYCPVSVDARNSTIFCFYFTHGQFTQVHEEVSYFLAKALPSLQVAWERYKK
jgi:hypothetical protein